MLSLSSKPSNCFTVSLRENLKLLQWPANKPLYNLYSSTYTVLSWLLLYLHLVFSTTATNTGLFSIPWTYQECCYLIVYAVAVSSNQDPLFPDTNMSHSFTSFKTLHKCHLLREIPGLLSKNLSFLTHPPWSQNCLFSSLLYFTPLHLLPFYLLYMFAITSPH